MPGDAVVQLDGVARSFGGVVALDGLDLRVAAGTVTVLLGPNGAGKTTAVRMVTGALPPERGTVRVFGLDPRDQGEAVRRRCGVVAAKSALYDRLSGYDNLRYAAELHELGSQAPIKEAAARFGIDDALDLRVAGYSTGMKTRLALARSILHDPDLLLLDEPTSGLDPESSHAVLRLIDELAAGGKTVVMCTHLLLEAEGLADQVVMLEKGKDLVSGTPEDLVARYWPHPAVLVEAEDRAPLGVVQGMEGVLGFEPTALGAQLTLDRLDRVPDLVTAMVAAGARIRRVSPHEPSLEELYFVVRRAAGAVGAAEPGAGEGMAPLPASVQAALAARRQEAAS
jgi:ABC-2 type transport system ATP-binding protein